MSNLANVTDQRVSEMFIKEDFASASVCRIVAPKILIHSFRLNLFRRSLPEVFCKKVFLKISQNSQEDTCVGVCFFKKVFTEHY